MDTNTVRLSRETLNALLAWEAADTEYRRVSPGGGVEAASALTERNIAAQVLARLVQRDRDTSTWINERFPEANHASL
jgi:hypothetical protein